ncbi:uncharacterized protein LY89DRAFT_95434 [Mollisia scopiformis]|uniref:Uncharacterized protein n=1 Tax=Mollisia scopiformis TaxID=149040 RepID=A0A194X6Q8_MOLSC|nr:uncharacterized protein LY89DRAFT_95434 [Mollisia scopiformis]KUJ15769.1 hypothetical protein LY89DRAFT_95434 [Mollisia scopiformis]
MKQKFDAAMQQSNDLFIQEQHAVKTAKRLAQENDQILDLLLDVNNSAQIPIDKRIDISSEVPPGDSSIPGLITDDDIDSIGSLQTSEGQALMAELRTMLTERAALNNASQAPTKSFAHLTSSTPHLSSQSASLPTELTKSLDPEPPETVPYSYLTPDQLDDYLYDIDASLGTVPPFPPHFHPQDLAFGNHHSPYNWLRRNQPQIFLQDGEGSEKSHGKPGALRGAGKRASIPAPSKPDALEIVEEDGQGYDFALGGGPSTTKGKRKRGEDDDGGYYPKAGGKEAKKPRASKKKKGGEEGEGAVKEKPASKRARKPKIPSPDPDAHPFGPM